MPSDLYLLDPENYRICELCGGKGTRREDERRSCDECNGAGSVLRSSYGPGSSRRTHDLTSYSKTSRVSGYIEKVDETIALSELKLLVRDKDPNAFLRCPRCSVPIKAKNLLIHCRKHHPYMEENPMKNNERSAGSDPGIEETLQPPGKPSLPLLGLVIPFHTNSDEGEKDGEGP